MKRIPNKFLLYIMAMVFGSCVGWGIGTTIALPIERKVTQEVQRTVEQGAEQKPQADVIEAHKKPDARKRVADSAVGPYQAVMHLIQYKDGHPKSYCSGFLVAPKVVLTNRHCLNGADSVVVEPGVNGKDEPALFLPIESRNFRLSESGKDYGVIFLSESLPLVPFGVEEFPLLPESADMLTAGYPGDKDYSTMWENKYHGFVSLNEGLGVISGGVAFGGQSGSPLFQMQGERFVARGILWGKTPCDEKGICPQEQVTYFVPFTDLVLREIQMWIAMSK